VRALTYRRHPRAASPPTPCTSPGGPTITAPLDHVNDRTPVAGAALAALAGILLLALQAAAETPEECLTCHGDRIHAQQFAASAHGTLGCNGCHTDITEYPHPEKPAAPDCATCHDDMVAAYQRGVHGQSRAQGGTEAATCTDCHGGIHALVPHAEPGSAVHWSNLAATCARCHADVDLAEKFRIPVVRPVEAYSKSVHAQAVAAGRRAAVCSDCHNSHDIAPARDPHSSLSRSNVPATCGKCHTDILATYRDSVHGEAVARGIAEAPTCTDCHGEHRILAHTDPASPVFTANIPVETCGRCHASTRLSEKYGLPRGQVTAFRDSYHGLALRAGQLTAANCASCHGVHDIHPSTDPRSHVHPANLPETCGKCHPGAGANFALGPVHVLQASTGVPAVHWIRVLYLWLIGMVVGSMGLHNLLDVLRKARRGALPVPAVPAGQPERMTRLLRWQHGLVMLSFTTLAYTGFALTYPEHWWAAPLLRWETELGLRGALHRLAAVVLLSSLAWHFVHLASSPRLRACLSCLLWSRQDVRDLFATLAYYLGRHAGPPRKGKFSYVEKAEYWAFLWGSAIMAATGLLLWFEDTALRYLPKWITDVATAIHFYEAVLAALAILVWHLYWVIFDPDVYPMDGSWWHGRAPAAHSLREEAPPPGSDPTTES
jgi:cytochrome b subunit of formate dehydrogenase